ncbi:MULTISPECIES: HNH endonuclease signature motif containing protein [unclassified Cryobacterium]|uniref:HNH endonuclease signature motif containing protein n=1 Tax=unclassified Cryobacterium TaxID=2649013 RepID=UPI00106A5076|nr:HNH endonuclease [Cryobacterium sp. MDB2-A-1]TFC12818.1 HNH endonuclease [Cryobacterium sp. MDB2-A-2]
MSEIEGQNGTAEARFWAKVNKSGECWIWTSSTSSYGYGRFRIGGEGSRNLGAHVVAYRWAKGTIPNGMVLDHLCRVRSCVNPAHLEIVTPEENSTRGMISRVAEVPNCPNGHPWSENTYMPRRGYRICKACAYPKSQEYNRKRRAALVSTKG